MSSKVKKHLPVTATKVARSWATRNVRWRAANSKSIWVPATAPEQRQRWRWSTSRHCMCLSLVYTPMTIIPYNDTTLCNSYYGITNNKFWVVDSDYLYNSMIACNTLLSLKHYCCSYSYSLCSRHSHDFFFNYACKYLPFLQYIQWKLRSQVFFQVYLCIFLCGWGCFWGKIVCVAAFLLLLLLLLFSLMFELIVSN